MKRAIPLVVALAVFAAGYLAGRGNHPRPAYDGANAPARTILYYVDPMHPAYTSDAPGVAPDCGMTLVPVYDDHRRDGIVAVRPASVVAAGTVRMTGEMQQLMGVRVAAVERTAATDRVHLYGRVAAEETRSYRIDAGSSGYLRELSGVTTGSQVRKDQWLATVSAPELRSPIQGFIVALEILQRSQAANENAAQIDAAKATLELSRDRLLTLGVSRFQIDEIAQTKVIPPAIRILAPADGFVLSRSVIAGQTLDRGHELFRIGDLSHVWILADVFGPDAALVRPGMAATVTIPGRGEVRGAHVSAGLLPQFDAAAQSSRVRIEIANPGFVLRPDMFVDVDLALSRTDTISVPAGAVRDSGLEQIVFVQRGADFLPQRVHLGRRGDGRVEIVDGLTPGERIVVSGAFLLDAESRLPRSPATPLRR
jgi:Cu(I)/Ag(I) efflux system membrane fusion protein